MFDDGRTAEIIDSRKSLFPGALQTEPLDMSSPAKSSLFHGGLQAKPLDMSSPAKSSGVENDYSGEEDIASDTFEPESVNFYVHKANVVWICQLGGVANYDPEALTLYIQPDPCLDMNAMTVMVKVMRDTNMDVLTRFVVKHWRGQGNSFKEPLITYQGREFDPERLTSSFEDTSTLMVHDRKMQRFPAEHSGKLWTCNQCK